MSYRLKENAFVVKQASLPVFSTSQGRMPVLPFQNHYLKHYSILFTSFSCWQLMTGN